MIYLSIEFMVFSIVAATILCVVMTFKEDEVINGITNIFKRIAK